MGFLDSLGAGAEAKRLRRFLRADESFMECDVVNLVRFRFPEGTNGATGQRVVSLTSHAMYMRPVKWGGFDVLRIAWPDIIDVAGHGSLVAFETRNAAYLIDTAVRGRPMIADLFISIAAHLRRLERFRTEVPVPGGSVIAVCRPLAEGHAPKWLLTGDEAVDWKNPAVRASLDSALAPQIAEYGPLW